MTEIRAGLVKVKVYIYDHKLELVYFMSVSVSLNRSLTLGERMNIPLLLLIVHESYRILVSAPGPLGLIGF